MDLLQVVIREFIRYNDLTGSEEVIRVYVGGNTEAAEQCFSRLRKSSPTLRGLGSWAAQLLLAFRVHHLNSKTCRQHQSQVQPSGAISDRWLPSRTLGPPLQL